MPTYITADNVRNACGAPDSLITDTQIEHGIDIVEKETERWMNTKFTPTLKIDVLDGTGTEYIITTQNPVLSVIGLTTNGTEVTPKYLDVYYPSGKIRLGTSAEANTFIEKNKDTKIKYYYAMMEKTTTTTNSAADVTAGTTVSIEVDDSDSFAVDDWVEIVGMDGYQEVFKISAIADSTHVTAERLVYNHEDGSIITKLEVPEYIKRFMEIEAAIYVAVYAIGGTYTFNTSYNLGELSVNKGEPYPQWREVIQRMLNERKTRLATIKPRFRMVVN